jgi:ketosteroid isomerase-like protein
LSSALTFEQVSEGIRAVQAAYANAFDDGRTEDIVDTFTSDGIVEIDGVGVFEGHEAIRAAYAGWTPTRPQRHILSSPLVTGWSDDEAEAATDVYLVARNASGWSIAIVARYFDTFRRKEDGRWRFSHRRSVSADAGILTPANPTEDI